jgi:D-alanyl-lipoteichoic acid acyltransferase DltB (MBOAT superfamily)
MATITYIVSNKFNQHKPIMVSTGLLHIVMFLLNRYADFYVLGFTFKNLAAIGLSFTMFKSIGYLIDSYKGSQLQCNYCEFMLYEINFLEIVQGPISLCQDWIGQIRIQHQWDWKNFYTGILMVLHGLVMKLMIANRLFVAIDCIKSDLSYQGAYVLFVIFAYAIYIYTDFSGGITIIRGIGKVLDIDINQNFQQPYLSKSVSSFWKRWDMSLNKWFTRYIYIPLGGSKKGNKRTIINILIVVAVAVVIYFAILLLLKGIDKKEINLIKSMI